MLAIVAFFTKLMPFLQGALSIFKKYQDDVSRQKDIDLGREIERSKQNEKSIELLNEQRQLESVMRESRDAARNDSSSKRMRDGDF